MTYLEDLLRVNREVFRKTNRSMLDNWPIIFTALVYSIINIFVTNLVFLTFSGPLSIIAGIISGFISASIVSNYLYLLYNIIFYNKINMEIFKNGFDAFLRNVYSVLVVYWMITYLLRAPSIIYLIDILIFIFINALPETIYQKQYSNVVDSISYSFSFIKENHIYWFIPVIILGLITYLVSGSYDISILKVQNRLPLGKGLEVRWILGQILFSYSMIYRGYLYKILSTSTKRKRDFMSKF